MSITSDKRSFDKKIIRRLKTATKDFTQSADVQVSWADCYKAHIVDQDTIFMMCIRLTRAIQAATGGEGLVAYEFPDGDRDKVKAFKFWALGLKDPELVKTATHWELSVAEVDESDMPMQPEMN